MLVLVKGHLEEISAVLFSFLWLFTLPGLRKRPLCGLESPPLKLMTCIEPASFPECSASIFQALTLNVQLYYVLPGPSLVFSLASQIVQVVMGGNVGQMEDKLQGGAPDDLLQQ